MLFAFHDVLGADRGLFFRDHILVFKPTYYAILESLRAGELPVHGRPDTSGLPVEQWLNSTFTPATLLLFAAPFDVAYDWIVIAHFLVLAAGAYALATSLSAERGPATIAAAVAALAGPVVSLENLMGALPGLAWAPWAYVCLHRLLVRPSAGRVAALALVLGLHLQGVIPTVALLDLLVSLALVLRVKPRIDLRLVLASLASVMLGLGIASIEVAPAVEALAGTRRGAGFDYDTLSGWALNPPMWIELFAPAFWEPPSLPVLRAPGVTGNPSDPGYFTTLYFGTALSVAAAAGVKGRAKWLWLATVFFLVVATGRHTPLHAWVASVPLLDRDRYAVKYLLLATAGIAALSGLSLGRVDPRRLLYAGAILTGAAIAGLIVARSPEFRAYLDLILVANPSQPRAEGCGLPALRDLAQAAMTDRLAHAAIFAGLLTTAAVLATRSARIARALPALVTLVVTADLARGATFAVYGASVTEQTPPARVLEVLRTDTGKHLAFEPAGHPPAFLHRDGRTFFEDLTRSTGLRARHFQPGLRRYFDLDINALSNALHAAVFRLISTAPGGDRMLDLLARVGVTHVTSASPELAAQHVLEYEVSGEAPEHVYRLLGARPFASAFSRWRSVRSTDLSTERLIEYLAAPENREVALVVDAPALPSRLEATCTGTAAVALESITRNARIDIVAHAPCESLVVVEEPAVRGWRAIVDDREVPIHQAEAGFVAALFPAGSHRLRFEYVPLTRPWIPVALVSLLITTVLGALGLVRWGREAR